MIINKILIDNCKCKIIFLITGMKHTTDIKAIPRKYKSELKQLMKELQEYVSLEEYGKFLGNCLNIKYDPSVIDFLQEADQIIEGFFKKKGNPGEKDK